MPIFTAGRRCFPATALALAAWLSAAAITAGCYTVSQEPPRDAESKRALGALKRHLRATLPFAKFDIREVPISAPGWTLFAGTDPEVWHSDVTYWVVRARRGVVTGEPLAELSLAYRSLEALGPEPLASTEDLSWLAVGLLARDKGLFDQRTFDKLRYAGPGSWWRDLYDAYEPALPQLVRQGDAALLVFWVYPMGRGASLSRYELLISADYEVTVSVSD
jgi:hypothetical protein